MPDPVLDIGLDAGGSKTALLAQGPQQAEPLSIQGPGANLQREGLEAAAQTLADLIQEAQQKLGERARSVCAGVAGAGRPADRRALKAALHARLNAGAPSHLRIVHDGEIALEAAFEGGSGIIVIVGTGSLSLARSRTGEFLRTGGWGYLLGDEGSGHVLGIHGLRAVAADLDGGPTTALRRHLAEVHGLTTRDELIDCVYRQDWKVQQVAPLVIAAAQEGDDPARRILEEQTSALAQQVTWLAHRCEGVEPRIALLGGLSTETHYREVLIDALLQRLPGWRFQKPLHPPVVGALRLAQQAP